MPLPQLKTGHVGLNVTDLDASVAFYEALFDFTVLARDDGERAFALLGHTGPVLTLWQQASGVFDPRRPGLHHLSFEVDSVDTVRAAEQTLKGLGVEFAYDGLVAHTAGAESGGIYFADPDGTRLEIYTGAGVDPATAPTAGAPTCGLF